jgi:alcohol dehydrogenase
MKALVYRGPGNKAIEDRPKPEIAAPADAIVKIVKTTICGTDLHILKGDVPTCTPGRILGHEGTGVIEVRNLRRCSQDERAQGSYRSVSLASSIKP